MYFLLFLFLAAAAAVFIKGIRIVRPTQRGYIETLGKTARYAEPGFHWIIPMIQSMYLVMVSEQTVFLGPMLVTTEDNVTVGVSAQVTFQVKAEPDSVSAALYHAEDYIEQLLNVSKEAIRDCIGARPLERVISRKERLSKELSGLLQEKAGRWGVSILDADVSDLDLPRELREIIHRAASAEFLRKAADGASLAVQIKATGEKAAEIIRAEGMMQAKILAAEGEAEAQRILKG
ncbi:SPFH domain-containing protein [Oscillospiraceae bacterium WX1]